MGVYTKIEIVSCPSKAAHGERVDISVKVTNLHTAAINIQTAVTYHYDGSGGVLYRWEVIAAGSSRTYSDWFSMPSADTEVRAASYYKVVDGYYYFDDQDVETIKLKELVPEFSALKITNYERR